MNLCHSTVGNKTNKSILRQKAQAHDKRLLEGSQAVLLLARVDNIEEDRGAGRWSREPVLDGCVGRVKFGGNRIGCDVLIVRRQRVSGQTEGADPETSPYVDLAEGVQDGAAGLLAGDWLELQQRGIRLLLERGIQSADGNDKPGSFHASAGEDVPTEADTITVLDLTPLLLELLVIHLGRVLGRMQICN